MILFDFTCDACSYTFERYVNSDCHTATCPQCDSQAHRIISPVHFKLEGVTGSFPTAADKWAKDHERGGEKANKLAREKQMDERN